MLNMAFSQSKYYVDALSENTKRGLREKVRRGEFPGPAPVGYLNDYRTKKLIVDGERAPIVKEMFRRYATGDETLNTIRIFLKERKVVLKGGKAPSGEAVARMLSNPIYYGHFCYNGEVYEGTHEPILTKSLFDEVQAIKAERWRHSSQPKTVVEKAYMGLLRCGECGFTITAEMQKGHIYYRCSKRSRTCECKQPYIRQEALDSQISALLQPYSLPADWAE